MNGEIYAVVKKYATNEVVPESYEDDGFADWHYKLSDYFGIYEKIMELTGNDYEISYDAANWCEHAMPGEIYEFREGEIEIEVFD